MGTWGYNAFENDDARDWIYEVEDTKDLTAIKDALDAITADPPDYLEAPSCQRAIAAAEAVAALAGKPSPSLPEELVRWIMENKLPVGSLRIQAVQALEKIVSESELKDLWEEGEGFDAWKSTVADLQNRLKNL
jgi:hypothetical protein